MGENGERLTQIRERLNGITSPTWRHCKDDKCACGQVWAIEADAIVHTPVYDFHNEGVPMPTKESQAANSVFIAHAPDDIRYLLELLEAQQKGGAK